MVYGCKVDYGKLKLVNINEKVVRLTRYIPLILVHIFLPFCEFDEQGLRKNLKCNKKEISLEEMAIRTWSFELFFHHFDLKSKTVALSLRGTIIYLLFCIHVYHSVMILLGFTRF